MSGSTLMSYLDTTSIRALGLTALAAVFGLHCATTVPGPKTEAEPGESDSAWTVPAEALGTQRLFRVRYEGQDGRGGMKLVLRLSSESTFEVLTSDALGRPLWSLQTSEMETLLIDHRARVFCRASEVRLPDPVLAAMPWQSLPRVLLGYLPTKPARIERRTTDEIDFRGEDGRRWTSRLATGQPSSWVLWEEDRPVLWWSRQGEGGMVSHRQGIQIKWREIVSEPLLDPVAELQIPSGYQVSECNANDLP